MKPYTVKIEIDINGAAFIIDACKTDYTDKKLSTYEWMLEELKSWDDLCYGLDKPGIYSVSIVGEQDSSEPEFTFIKEK